MHRLSIKNKKKWGFLAGLQESQFCETAVRRIWTPNAECLPQFCQKWIRELVQDEFGNLYDEYWRSSAKLTAAAFLNSPYSINASNGTLPGDILYQTSGHGPYGHVGVRVWNGWVCQNSTRFWDGIDARGVQSFGEFGRFDVVVRFPGAYLDKSRPKDRELTAEEMKEAREHTKAAVQRSLFG